MLSCELCGEKAYTIKDETGIHNYCDKCYKEILIDRALKEDNIEILNDSIYTIDYDIKENSRYMIKKNGAIKYAKNIWHRGNKEGLLNTIECIKEI